MRTQLYNGDRQPDWSIDRHCALNLKKKNKKRRGFLPVFFFVVVVFGWEKRTDLRNGKYRDEESSRPTVGEGLVPNVRVLVLTARGR